jgi:hypothetical protein
MMSSTNMERYIVQKAQQALEALTTEESLEDRLRAARMHFSFVTDDHYLQSAPAEVQKYLTAVRYIPHGEPRPETARTIREAIESIFEAWGRESRRVNDAGNVIETSEHKGDFKEW